MAALLSSTGDFPTADSYPHHTQQEQSRGELPDQFQCEWTEKKQSFDLILKMLYFFMKIVNKRHIMMDILVKL